MTWQIHVFENYIGSANYENTKSLTNKPCAFFFSYHEYLHSKDTLYLCQSLRTLLVILWHHSRLEDSAKLISRRHATNDLPWCGLNSRRPSVLLRHFSLKMDLWKYFGAREINCAVFFFTYIPCILIISKFVYQLMHNWIVLKQF